MGATFYHATHYKKNGTVDRKAECDALINSENRIYKREVLKSSMVSSIYYAAVRRTDKKTNESKVVAYIFVTYGRDKRDPYFNFGYKDMDETIHPFYYDCSKGILDLLDETEDEMAITWRNLCRKNLIEKKKKSWLKELSIGEKIKYKKHDGEEIILIKHPPAYQFKTWFWYCEDTRQYVSKKLVTENNSEKL